MKIGIIIFPGSNCDRDLIHVMQNVLQQEVQVLWHKDTSLPNFTNKDMIMLPGGFSYGDYLRSGAIASHSPIMKAVKEHALNGGLLVGICNGFQILCETGLLPGALLHNDHQKFNCKNIFIKAEHNQSPITKNLTLNKAYKIPIAHAEGRYFIDANGLQNLIDNNQILFKYCDNQANINDSANPNGSINNIAGICNKEGNVIGLMPHPERAAENVLGNTDGLAFLESLVGMIKV